MRLSCFVSVAAAALVSSSFAHAAVVQVDMYGVVDFNVIQGNQAGIPSGAPVHMGFQVDSNVFTNSASFPTRGYNVILPSFQMTVGGQPINIIDPQPFGDTAYFVLRNNDPAVDGFFFSTGTDFPGPWSVTVPGLAPTHELDFLATYPDTTLSSLDILGAVGSYDLTGLSVFNWGVGRFGNHGAEYSYESMTISVVPAPGAASLFGLLAFAGARRRR